MTLQKRLNASELFHDLKAMGRSDFTYDGANALQEYLDSEDVTIEYDPIAFCCEFAEYDSVEEFNADYGKECESWQDAQDYTLVIEFGYNGAAIIQQF